MKNVFSPANRLIKLSSKGFKTNQTHFNTGGYFGNCSGIKVCIFGGNSSIGSQIAVNLLSIGTPVNLVHRNPFDTEIPYTHVRLLRQSNPFGANTRIGSDYNTTDEALKNLRPYGEVGIKVFSYCPEIANEYDVEQAIKSCDVVINTIGPKPVIRNDEDFEEANIIIPRIIAKVCARQRNNPVKRLIHFSANGVDPDSISRNLRTKWIGEQEVREYFPEATIIRPTEVLNHNITSSFTGYFFHCLEQNNKAMMLIDDGKALRQPICETDMNQAILNILDTQDSIGQTYELGGSQVYTLKELYEFLANNLFHRFTFINFTYDDFMRMYLAPNTNWEKAAHWLVIRPDYLTMQRVDNIITKKKGIKTMEDLGILPLATHHYLADVSNWLLEKVAPERMGRRSLEELEADDEGH